MGVGSMRVCAGIVFAFGSLAPSNIAHAQPSTPVEEASPLTVDASAFDLSLTALMQFRYTVSAAPEAPDPVDDVSLGFGFRRLRPALNASSKDKSVRVFVQSESAGGGELDLLDAWVSYQLTDHVRLRVGRYNLQYDRELITPAPMLLAVDRSALANTLNVDAANRVEGIELRIHDDIERLFLSFNEGLGVADSPFNDARSDWGVTARYERMLIGDSFSTSNAFTAPWGTPQQLQFGAAVHTQHLTGLGHRFASTMDLTYRHDGFNAMVSLGAQVTEDRNRPPFNEPEHDWGMVMQSGWYVTEQLEPFVRSELGTTSDRMHPDLAVITAGFNYYIYGQAFKFSTDVSVAFNGVGPAFDRSADGLLITPDGANRFIFHAQLQVLF